MTRGRTTRRVALAVLIVVGLADAVLLLWPNGAAVHRINLEVYLFFLNRGMPRSVRPEAYADALNIALLIPIGWAVATLAPRVAWWQLASMALAGVVLIELYQDLSAIQRVTSLLDVVLNTSGFMLGVWLARRRPRSGLDEDARLDE